MADATLYGFDGSTFVRTVKIVLNTHDVDYEQVPVNVLAGEPRQPEHLARHPFGKVPVLDIDGLRIRETDAICRYVDETRDGPDFSPASAADRAKMNEAIGLIGSYGYGALIGAAGYHLFPDFIGGQDDAKHAAALEGSETLLRLLMESRGGSGWIAGPTLSLADLFLGPIIFYTSLTPDADRLLGTPGMTDWWTALQAETAFKSTEPDLG